MVKAGNLCFVKVRGYSPWPARVNVLPSDVVIPRSKLPVFFYGTHEVSFVPENNVFEFEKFKNVYGVFKPKNMRFNEGMKELKDNPKILQLGFDRDAVKFLSQFYKFNKKSTEVLEYTISEKSNDKPSISLKISNENVILDCKREKSKKKQDMEFEAIEEISKIEILDSETRIEISKDNKTANSEVMREISKKVILNCETITNKSKEKQTMDFEETKISEENQNVDLKENRDLSKKNTIVFESIEETSKTEIGKCETVKISEENQNVDLKEIGKLSKKGIGDISKSEILYYERNIEISKDNKAMNFETIEETENQGSENAKEKKIVGYETGEKLTQSENILTCYTRKRIRSDSNEREPQMIKRTCSIVLTNYLDSINHIENKTNIKKSLNNFLKEEKDFEKDGYENVPSGNFESESDLTSFKSPIDHMEIYSIKRAEAMKLHDKFKAYLLENAHLKRFSKDVIKSEKVAKFKKEKMLKHEASHPSKRNKESTKLISRSQKFSQHSKPPLINECGTYSDDKKYRNNNVEERNLRIVSQLSVIDREIKRSLIVGQENHVRCISLMTKLEGLKELKLIFLCKVPDIVTTMRKCRRYKKNESIRSSASALYRRFYQIYQQSDIDEKSEAGAELLKRNHNDLKSAQHLLDELFTLESKKLSYKLLFNPSITLSSPSSAPSHHSSSNNTPMPPSDQEPTFHSDHIIMNIHELLKNGSLQLIEIYEAKKRQSKYSYLDNESIRNEQELYKQLGV